MTDFPRIQLEHRKPRRLKTTEEISILRKKRYLQYNWSLFEHDLGKVLSCKLSSFLLFIKAVLLSGFGANPRGKKWV